MTYRGFSNSQISAMRREILRDGLDRETFVRMGQRYGVSAALIQDAVGMDWDGPPLPPGSKLWIHGD